MKKRFCRGLVASLLVAGVCALCSLAAPFLDSELLHKNAAGAVDSIWNADTPREVVGGFESARLDDYATVLMIKTACFSGKATYLEKVFGGLRTEVAVREDTDSWGAFCTYTADAQEGDIIQSYPRYWHGYIFPLRLLMSLMTYTNAMMLCYGAEFLLIAACISLGTRRGIGKAMVPGFALTLLLMMPAAMGICAEFVPCPLVALGACALLLRWGESIESRLGHGWLFAASGIVVSYLDLLTFPVMTLAFPMTLDILLHMKDMEPRALLRRCIESTVAWGAGYAGMWALKWGLNVLAFGPEGLAGVIGQIALRMSSKVDGGEVVGRGAALMRNIRLITGKRAFQVLLAAAAVLLGAGAVRSLRRGRGLGAPAGACCLLIPVACAAGWMLLTTNHIHIHYYFTYRTLWCALFPLSVLLTLLTCGRGAEKPGKA